MRRIFLLIALVASLFGNTIDIAKDLFDNKEIYKEAIEIFEKYKDDGEAQYYLGKAYLYGMGVEKNEKKAFEFAKKSADKNNPSGLNLLGVMYEYGQGVEKDGAKALKYYQKASNLKSTKAIRNLALMYENGNFVKKDLNKAIELNQQLINLKDKYGFLGLANINTYQTNNYEEALKYYLLFEENDGKESSAFQNMAVIYSNKGNTEKAIEYYRKSSKLGNNHSMLLLFDFLEKNENIKYRLYENEHFDSLIKSAELGNTDAILEIIYDDNLPNILGEEKFLIWMKKGIDLKLESAYLPLYMYYQDKKDFKNLKLFLEKAYYEDKNLDMGCYLSSYYLNFINIYPEKADFEKAYILASEIIDKNPIDKNLYLCYSTLSSMYEKGNYLVKSLEKAIEISKKSLEVSEDFAKKYDLEYIKEKEKELEIELKKNSKQLEKIDIKDEKIFPILNNFTKKEQVISAIETKDYFFFAVNDKSIKMYDKKDLKFLKEFRPWISYGVEGNPMQMAFDENKKLLYFSTLNSIKDISKNGLIHVLNINTGKIIKTLKNTNAIRNTYLDISSDGKYLVAINNNNLFNIINTEDNTIQHYNFNEKGTFLSANIKKEKDDYIAYFGNKDDEKIYKFSLNEARNISIEDFNYQTKFKTVNVEQATKIFDNMNNIDFSMLINNFNFENLDIKNILNPSKQKIPTHLKVNKKYDGQVIEFVNSKNNVRKDYLMIGDVKILNTHYIKNKYILLITSDISFMPILNEKGEVIANLQGFSTIQKNIDLNKHRLITSGDDNVVHVFDLKNLDNLKYNDNEYDEDVLNGFIKTFGDTKDEIIKGFENFDEEYLVNYQKTNSLSFTPTKEQVKNYFKLFAAKKELIFPIASLYIKNEKDWIIYTREGLFTYGGNGKDLLKYHQNQGLYKEAKIIENDKLFDKFYRPDLIKKILAGEKVEIPMDVKSVILNILPPELKILENKMLNIKDIELTYQICDAGNGMADLKLLINGQAINPPQSRGISIEKIDNQNDKCEIYKSVHTLYPGNSTIELKAYDKEKYIANVSEKLEVNANYKIVEKSSNISKKDMNKDENYELVDKANLYLLSLAVDDYENKNLNLKYPVKDVNTIKEEIKLKSKSTFENIYTFDLYNEKVTKENINQIFDEISKKIKYNDTFILYIAGHGIDKDGKYQLVSYKINEKISIDDLKQNLSKIVTNKSLVLLDTCQSGAAIDDIVDKTATVNRLSHDDNRNYIVASSKDQVALEGYNEHGVFTYSVLDAFKNNENLKVWGLAVHVSEVVPKITQEKFHFEQRPESKLNHNFILSGDN